MKKIMLMLVFLCYTSIILNSETDSFELDSNWTDAYITAGIAGGVNWASLRASFGNTSTSTNWQAFGV